MRLLAAQAIVLIAGAATTRGGGRRRRPSCSVSICTSQGCDGLTRGSACTEEAYGYATVMSIGGALAVSALAALAVSFYVSRRLQRSITEVASAATRYRPGNYEIRVSPPGLGDDFDALLHRLQ